MESSVNTRRFYKSLGKVIRARRLSLGLSQEDFADEANIHRTYVSSIELGKVDVSLGVTLKISTALKLPLNKLIQKAENLFVS